MAKTITDNAAFLREAKEALVNYKETAAREEELVLQEKQQAKTLAAEKKAVEDNVSATVKKRRSELNAKYDTEISRLQDSVKKLRSQREKAKQKSMKERIDAQNAPFREENREMNSKIRGIFRQDRVPSFCNSTLFYALYYPRSAKEILILLVTFAVCCVLIPCGLYALLPQKRSLWLILIYIAVIVIFGGIYIIVGNITKDAHREALLEARQIRRSMEKNRKRMRENAKAIRSETSEEHYDLSEFDGKIREKEEERTSLESQKSEALAAFERETAPAIEAEIREGSRERLEALTAEYNETTAGLRQEQANLKEASLRLSDDYESYIGKDFMREDRLDALLALLESGQAASITEAKELYQSESSRK